MRKRVIYTLVENPMITDLKKMALLKAKLLLPSGQDGAITAPIMALVNAGDHSCSKTLYGCTHAFFVPSHRKVWSGDNLVDATDTKKTLKL